ncbi:hypothetical protein [Actinoplanes sp. M2I2]|uniref:hypothetical protein n=1 Tax=Actinoplanes sp. M2I2 TaxID=1734444 RepID=UPI0020206849|nr:hypothetical protein [Actinoplanes sp. M2I2]
MDLSNPLPSQPADELAGQASITRPPTPDVADSPMASTTLAGLADAAQRAVQAVESSGEYTPREAVIAVEATTAALHRLSTNFVPYIGDYSAFGATAMGQASELLGRARTMLSDARNHLVWQPPFVIMADSRG